MLKIFIRVLINTLVGAVLVYFWFKLIDFKAVLAQISQVNPLFLVPVVATFVAAAALRSFRLKILLANPKISFLSLVKLNFLSQLLSFTIPIRAGEVAKGVYLNTAYEIPFAKAVIWIFLDRFLDFWLTIITAFILLLIIPTQLPVNIVSNISVMVLVFSFGLIIVSAFPQIVRFFVKIINFFAVFPRLKKIFISLGEFVIECTSFLKRGFRETSMLLSLTFLALVTEAFGWYLLFKLFFSSVDFLKMLLGSLLTALTYLIPAAPGYVGSAEASGLAVFTYGLGFDKTVVSASTVLMHALTLLYMLIFGVLSLYLLKFDLKSVFRKILQKK